MNLSLTFDFLYGRSYWRNIFVYSIPMKRALAVTLEPKEDEQIEVQVVAIRLALMSILWPHIGSITRRDQGQAALKPCSC